VSAEVLAADWRIVMVILPSWALPLCIPAKDLSISRMKMQEQYVAYFMRIVLGSVNERSAYSDSTLDRQ
jgi:hypothetical protein